MKYFDSPGDSWPSRAKPQRLVQIPLQILKHPKLYDDLAATYVQARIPKYSIILIVTHCGTWRHMPARVELRRLREAAKKQRARQRRKPVVCPSVESLIYLLVLMGAPWECIQSIAALENAKRSGNRARCEDLTIEVIKAIASRTHARMAAELRLERRINSNPKYVAAQARWLRWSTAQWLMMQNMKGLSIPSPLVIEDYISKWGPRPYSVDVSSHVDHFNNPNFRRKWLQSLRSDLNFMYGSLPIHGVMTEAEKRRKVERLHV